MLILRRRLDEKVILGLPDGRRVTIQVAEIIRHHAVKLAFFADADIPIWREEIAPKEEIAERESVAR